MFRYCSNIHFANVSFPISQPRTTDNIPLAGAAIIFTVLALSLGDALIKLTSSNLVIWQIFVLRSALLLPLLLGAVLLFGLPFARDTRTYFWIAARSLMLVGMWVAYYACLPHVDLSVAAAGYYTLPIFITLFSAVFVGDRIGRLGWLAVAVGFLGTLMIIKPSPTDFNAYVLLPLLSAVLYALAMILTRTKCQDVHPIGLSMALNLAFILAGGSATGLLALVPGEQRTGFLMAPWAAMATNEWLAILLLAAAILIGSVGAAFAYQRGPSSVIGTFDFAYVAFAVSWGIVFFEEWPDAVTVVGIFLIVAAGILSLRANAQASLDT